jgi:hypothetical protein
MISVQIYQLDLFDFFTALVGQFFRADARNRQRLIPVDELECFLAEHVEPAAPAALRGLAGRPVALPDAVADRIRLEFARGRSFGEIARALTPEGIATAHGGRRWWPSTVRAVLLRASG